MAETELISGKISKRFQKTITKNFKKILVNLWNLTVKNRNDRMVKTHCCKRLQKMEITILRTPVEQT